MGRRCRFCDVSVERGFDVVWEVRRSCPFCSVLPSNPFFQFHFFLVRMRRSPRSLIISPGRRVNPNRPQTTRRYVVLFI